MKLLVFMRQQCVSGDGLEIRYVEQGRRGGFEIIASKEGIILRESGVLCNQQHLQAMAKAVSDAWKDHLRLRGVTVNDEVERVDRGVADAAQVDDGQKPGPGPSPEDSL
jgi:hypothetical protein